MEFNRITFYLQRLKVMSFSSCDHLKTSAFMFNESFYSLTRQLWGGVCVVMYKVELRVSLVSSSAYSEEAFSLSL